MEESQRQKTHVSKAFVRRVIVLISKKKKRNEEKKRLELWKAMQDCSAERLAAVISSAKLEFGDELKDVCDVAESVLRALLRERFLAPASQQNMTQQNAEDRKTLRERLMASDDELSSPESFLCLYRQTVRAMPLDAKATSQTPSVTATPDHTRCNLQPDVANRTCSLLSLLQDFTTPFSERTTGGHVSDDHSKMPTTYESCPPNPEEGSAISCIDHEIAEQAKRQDSQPRISLRALLCQNQGDGECRDRDSSPLPFTIDTPSSDHSSYHSFDSDIEQSLPLSESFGNVLNAINPQMDHCIGSVSNEEPFLPCPESARSAHSSYHSLDNDVTMNIETSSFSESEPIHQEGVLEELRTESLPSAHRSTPSHVSLFTLLQQTDGGTGENFILAEPHDCSTTFFHYSSDGEANEVQGIAELDSLCCVCMSGHKGAAFIPCGHTFCRMCSRRLVSARGTCPLCNKDISGFLNIY